MCWTADQIEGQIMREPELGLALCKHVTANNLQMQMRLAEITFFDIRTRVALSLLRLCREAGGGGAIQDAPPLLRLSCRFSRFTAPDSC